MQGCRKVWHNFVYCGFFAELAEMLVQYVAALNMPGGVPEVDSTWELVLKSTYDRAIANALAVYEEQMQVEIQQLPLEVDDLMVAHSKANSSALELFESEVDCKHSPHDKYLAKLQVYMPYSAKIGSLVHILYIHP